MIFGGLFFNRFQSDSSSKSPVHIGALFIPRHIYLNILHNPNIYFLVQYIYMELATLFTWQDNSWLDLWTIVHLFWGAILGLFFVSRHKTYAYTFIVSFSLIMLWEYTEYLWGISESATNIFTDIVVGILGVVIGYILPAQTKQNPYQFLIPLILITIVLEYIGWIHYLSQ